MPITVLAAALAVGTAACGASGGSAGPGTTAGTKAAASPGSSADPLAGLTSQQIAKRAVADTEAAPSVRVVGGGSDSGQAFTIDLTLVRGKGCEGTVAEGKRGSFQLVYHSTTVWLRPDSAFYQSQGIPAAMLTILKGKYLELKASGSGLASMAGICTMSHLLSQFTLDAGTTKGIMTTINGQPAVKITDKTGTGYAYVSDTTTPELLRVEKAGSGGGRIDFTYYATPVAITPPPASQVVDASKFGL
jgi:hypothetical protein